MSIVLNELTWAEEALRSKELGSRPYETIIRIAKYYTYNGFSKKETRRRLEEFLVMCDQSISVVAWSSALDRAVKYAAKHEPIVIDGINVSKTELEKINALDGTQVRRLAFTLLCVAKYNRIVSPNTLNWVRTDGPEIMRMANVKVNVRRQSLLYTRLRDAGLIRFSRKVDNLSVQVLFIDSDETAIRVSDFRNLGYQYLMYRGEPYAVCQHCGIVYKRTVQAGSRGRPQKYCPDCAVKMRVKSNVDSVMRLRAVAVQ